VTKIRRYFFTVPSSYLSTIHPRDLSVFGDETLLIVTYFLEEIIFARKQIYTNLFVRKYLYCLFLQNTLVHNTQIETQYNVIMLYVMRKLQTVLVFCYTMLNLSMKE